MTTAQYLQGGSSGISLQGGTNTLQGSSPSLQGSPNTLQVTANPQTQDLSFGTTLGATTTAAPADTGYYDAEAAAAAAAKAQRIAQANALKGGLTGIVNNIKSVYDAIYGDIDTVGADKTRAVNTRYNKESTALVDQFATDFPQIGNAYSARNTYDSSYRKDAEAGAQKQYNNMQDTLATGRDEDLAKVGQFVATQRAGVNADKTSLQQMQDLIARSEDPDELTQLQQTLNDRLSTVQASRAGLRSQDAYRSEANALVSTADRSQELKQTLGNIISGAAPAPLKRSVANKLIQSSGLPADVQQTLVDDFERQLSGASTNPKQQVVA